MKKHFLSSFLLLSLGICSSCTIVNKEKTQQPMVVEVVKTIEVPAVSLEEQALKTHKLGIIGEFEPVYFLPMKKPENHHYQLKLDHPNS